MQLIYNCNVSWISISKQFIEPVCSRCPSYIKGKSNNFTDKSCNINVNILTLVVVNHIMINNNLIIICLILMFQSKRQASNACRGFVISLTLILYSSHVAMDAWPQYKLSTGLGNSCLSTFWKAWYPSVKLYKQIVV